MTGQKKALISWYGPRFKGRPTASGEIFDPEKLTAAHKTLPFGTIVRLTTTDLTNPKAVIVRINDRGPFVGNREYDVSQRAAEILGIIDQGVAEVWVEKIDEVD